MREGETKMSKEKILLFIIICAAACAAVSAQHHDGSPRPAVKTIAPQATLVSGVTGAIFSPSGKLTVLQTDAGFYLLPTDRLSRAAAEFENSRFPFVEGQAKGFLPVSEKIVYAPRRGLYTGRHNIFGRPVPARR